MSWVDERIKEVHSLQSELEVWRERAMRSENDSALLQQKLEEAKETIKLLESNMMKELILRRCWLAFSRKLLISWRTSSSSYSLCIIIIAAHDINSAVLLFYFYSIVSIARLFLRSDIFFVA